MRETTLQKQLRELNDRFDEQERLLKEMRQKHIDELWKYHIDSGQLKGDLS